MSLKVTASYLHKLFTFDRDVNWFDDHYDGYSKKCEGRGFINNVSC